MDFYERGEDVNWFIPVQEHSKPSSLITGNSSNRSTVISYSILFICSLFNNALSMEHTMLNGKIRVTKESKTYRISRV
jgi:hypothetical protein